LRARMGASGRRRVVQFQATAVVSRIEGVYRALTETRTKMAAE
jgi:hypothetical protein